jgi:hypothetical protein
LKYNQTLRDELLPLKQIRMLQIFQFLQKTWWDMIIEHFNLDLYVEISQYENEQRYHVLHGKKPTTDINELDYERISKFNRSMNVSKSKEIIVRRCMQ